MVEGAPEVVEDEARDRTATRRDHQFRAGAALPRLSADPLAQNPPRRREREAIATPQGIGDDDPCAGLDVGPPALPHGQHEGGGPPADDSSATIAAWRPGAQSRRHQQTYSGCSS